MRTPMLIACALTACVLDPATDEDAAEARKHFKDAGVVDAERPPPPPSSGSGTVTCYTAGDPSASCNLPVHCCFGNYSSDRNGECTTSRCAWGTIACDGPEDCGAGERCCAHAQIDPI